jgi:4-hydroxy-tetrahydrodipicolinate synthase
VTPYYNKPNPEGLYQHYKAIAAATPLPIIVYSIQGRTGINVEPATLKRLAEIETIVGVKEASGNVSQMATIAHLLPDNFSLLCGDDAITIPVISLGGHGVISVVSNEIPAEMTKLTQLALAGDYAGARAIQRKFFDLMSVNFCEPNPAPAKAAMAMMGLLEEAFRLPMVPVSDASRAKIQGVLQACGLLNVARGNHAD